MHPQTNILKCNLKNKNDTETDDIKFLRHVGADGQIREDYLAVDDFNAHYDFKECGTEYSINAQYKNDPTLLVIDVPLGPLVKAYKYFQKKDLSALGSLHNVLMPATKKQDMVTRLYSHKCSNRCHKVLCIFKARSKGRSFIPSKFCSVLSGLAPTLVTESPERVNGRIPPHQTDVERKGDERLSEDEPELDEFAHLSCIDDQTRLRVISDWQQAMSPDNISVVVCSVCGTRTKRKETEIVKGKSVDLTLLRNDDLPECARPVTYNFQVYQRAILNAKGLSDPNTVSDMIICHRCYGSLCSGSMPKFALCNWLYYGKEALPRDIKLAFEESSMFERVLISRARCNSICCKFNVNGEDRSDRSHQGQQKGIRGNVMVAPLDAMRLHAILPPKIGVKDTMTAVVVGDRMPTKETISKLSPVLVRKSRIQMLLNFLMTHNAHYAPSDDLSYSQENIDAIHDSGDQSDLPKTVEIGHLQMQDGIENINSDYTPRNEDEWLPEEDVHELMMENVGFTEGDASPEAYNAMKVAALERCLSGKPFVASGTGNRMIPDFNNPSILTWLFPHLDPWGIGGFHEKRRKIKISLDEQLSHLLNSEDTTFERDPEFPFVLYNMGIKSKVSCIVRFQVSKEQQLRVVSDLDSIDMNELKALAVALEKNPSYRPQDPGQKKILSLLQKVTMSTHSLPGSNGYKLAMRRNVRAIINAKGIPTLFITLNPSDVHNPIVRIFGAEEADVDTISQGEDIQSWRRRIYAAKNPSACAKFFDLMITTFIDVVLGYGKDQPGLYGYCEAYYRVVEAQGKGTLHLHMLVWLRGHLPPQALREKLCSSTEYRERFVKWLESIIKNEFPLIHENLEDEPSRSKRVRSKELGEPHPGTISGPHLSDFSLSRLPEFWHEYKEHLIRLLNEYNWHEHTGTCWKYLKRGEEKKDANCRMRMDGRTQPETLVDTATGHFQLRRLHPWLSSYTDVVTFLMKCNMNIQFIGTGLEAKAFIYYVTDYLTKLLLPLHHGLAALAYGLRNIHEQLKVNNQTMDQYCTSALIKFVNAMMGRHEISHQQVMSYLVGGGDCYTSEKFQNLHLTSFLRHITAEEVKRAPRNCNNNHDEDDITAPQDNICLTVDQDGARIDSQVLDYIYRPTHSQYDAMSVYDFVARTSKAKVQNKDKLTESTQAFSSWNHPQKGTRKVCLRSVPVLPVILGPSMPGRKSESYSSDVWAKHILTLFKPWRTLHDLKKVDETWSEAYSTFEQKELRRKDLDIIKNMELLTECADARFQGAQDGVHPTQTIVDAGQEDEEDELPEDLKMSEDIQEWKAKYCTDLFADLKETLQDTENSLLASNHLKDIVGKTVLDALDALHVLVRADAKEAQDKTPDVPREIFKEDIQHHYSVMQKKRKRLLAEEEDHEGPDQPKKKQRSMPFVDVSTIPLYTSTHRHKFELVLEGIVEEMNLRSNKEQLEAFLTIAKHVGEREPDQLLMFVSGVGGTGKSHIIKSIVKLFERINRRTALLLGAPTGSSAILIDGSTLHSLILECPGNEKKKNTGRLARIWNGVTYLIVDEVSMLSAVFMSKLSDAVKQAKGDDPRKACQIFGGVNVIFMGDFCQLKPAGEPSLYSATIINQLASMAANKKDIIAMNGIFVWRQVTNVVELVKNCRHAADAEYSQFLSRLRVGKCISPNTAQDTTIDDYRYLQTRLLTNIYKRNPKELALFADAPFIVGTKAIRDTLNLRIASFHASRLKKDLHLYHSKDNIRRQPPPSGYAEILWSLQSTRTRDAAGRLPLFEGMKVMVTENIAFDSKIVNGTEGVVRSIVYEEDEAGRRYATVVYVYIEAINFQIDGLEENVVPIFPVRTNIKNEGFHIIGLEAKSFSRLQLPLVPAYAYTDYKSQGRTLSRAIVDITSAKGQGAYVMLSRVTSLAGIAILRWFPPSKLYHRLSAELRAELDRLRLRT
ncbi:hypothetical protein CVT26_011176 [Gymnopilus dilepis]|uniref:ATP-dependent DNA helicase n=1 Tax=Gymnopilus dilepis TaxID=231916 RepID=A0A409VJT9_9AGAR|nr:hypothetical protein CVT26_011176 [Gymnopilus dilepis]